MQQRVDDLKSAIRAKNPNIAPEQTDRLIDSLPLDKLERIPFDSLPRVLEAMESLDQGKPFRIFTEDVHSDSDRELSLYFVGYDHSYLFSILTGVLASTYFDIREGSLLTSRPLEGKRIAVDFFSGVLTPDMDIRQWSGKIENLLTEFYILVEKTEGKNAKKNAGRDAVQQRIIELVTRSLSRAGVGNDSILIPIHLKIEQKKRCTGIEIKSFDTPFFLYSLSTVLNLHYLRIEYVRIKTMRGRLIDYIEFTDHRGQPITQERILNRIRLSILISKQFTFFLDRAPDPAKALQRFDSLIQDVQQLEAADDFREMLASPDFHSELARLLGTSDFIWEDFIRIQRDSIFPIIKSINKSRLLSSEPEQIENKLQTAMEKAGEGKEGEALNEFKNRENFLIDMDHILVRDLDFFFLSSRLSALADAVVRQAWSLGWKAMVEKYGTPRTAGGLAARWAVFGLGKLGGQALGYASDLELICVFADNGHSDGKKPLSNREFFERFFKYSATLVNAKKEGIFHVDLRLRPYSRNGPVAVKLDKFDEYFRAGGKAHSAERLALVRMRHIAGNRELATQCIRIRDHIVYESDSIIISELRQLRKVQLSEKLVDDRINVKFSPGALVDLEYNVQILQIIHGRKNESLRTPGIHNALETLNTLGTLDSRETGAMVAAYRFHRNVINGLRMLRGNAEDLFLPHASSREFRHLARRIGYKSSGELSEAHQLLIDFETHSAAIRSFVERHLGRDAIPGARRLTVVDMVLNEVSDPAEREEFFRSQGFSDSRKAAVNLNRIASLDSREPSGGGTFIQLAILAWDRICNSPDPDMALNNWEQFSSRLAEPAEHFRQLLSQPRRMDILFGLFASSQFLADSLIQNPEFLLWPTNPDAVMKPRTQIEMEPDMRDQAAMSSDRADWLNRLRTTRKKEIIRIGVRDIALGVKIEEIMGEISFLARSCTEVALQEVWKRGAYESNPSKLCVLAFGKLGSWELNYSSDIDLLCIYETTAQSKRETEIREFTQVFRELVQDLNDFTQEGQAYRVDMRLRPYGVSGPLVSSVQSTLEYYEKNASPWEFQALIKLKPIAGNLALGEKFLEKLKPLFQKTWERHDPREIIRSMRQKSIGHHIGGTGSDIQNPDFTVGEGFDVKHDRGGIRDIEFFIQGMQMIHSSRHQIFLTGNSLRAIQLLLGSKLITSELAHKLTEYYTLFRRVEHYLQLAHNRQQHRLPTETAELSKLASCLAPDKTSEMFYRYFTNALREVHRNYREFIISR